MQLEIANALASRRNVPFIVTCYYDPEFSTFRISKASPGRTSANFYMVVKSCILSDYDRIQLSDLIERCKGVAAQGHAAPLTPA